MKRKLLRNYEQYWAHLMSLPGIIILFTFVLLPLLLSFGWSITDKRLISPLPTKIIGIENFKTMLSIKRLEIAPSIEEKQGFQYPNIRNLLREDSSGKWKDYHELFSVDKDGHMVVWIAKDPYFWKALYNTLRFVMIIVPLQGGIALLLALFVNSNIYGKTIFRTIYFTPVVISMTVVSIIWIFILNENNGLLNSFLSSVSNGKIDPIPWLTEKRYAYISIFIVTIWQAVGFQMIIFLAGLQSIPVNLYESAIIDGANRFQQFRYVTLPMLTNTIVFVIISTTILAFRIFTQIDIMTRGGPEESTMSIIYYIIQKGFREQKIGYASALTSIFFLIVLFIALIQKMILKYVDETE